MAVKSSSGTQAKAGSAARSAARLGAVQALYQIEMTWDSAGNIVAEFIDHRLGEIIEGDHYAAADKVFFNILVRDAGERMAEIDDHVTGVLAKGWTLKRIEPVARAILRAGICELITRPDVPTAVVINEYIDVAKAFFDDSTPGFINGVLDKLAKNIRKK
ncbi:MAG: transcription antitermination factor NusB [Alphaproteobacteria bacterium]|nr:transcription antitermination factor NusB [Alphaproteobacteria bacterium]